MFLCDAEEVISWFDAVDSTGSRDDSQEPFLQPHKVVQLLPVTASVCDVVSVPELLIPGVTAFANLQLNG